MSSQRPCTCGGTNDRCCWCWGSGYLHGELAASETDIESLASHSSSEGPLQSDQDTEEASDELFDTSLTREKNSQLDGSYGYHPFRENGRFGSHPSHDPHHDESWP
jgi:hypothetical protein